MAQINRIEGFREQTWGKSIREDFLEVVAVKFGLTDGFGLSCIKTVDSRVTWSTVAYGPQMVYSPCILSVPKANVLIIWSRDLGTIFLSIILFIAFQLMRSRR